ncbi:RagB/SusD family nutrient uptake outer membrane protein [Mucilaginibacter paludis]|uniref:RagB/SusD domain-containing protein n=1 Tax=Mucilaginibacter paludis DSM 18603 TaxID=714943 RepID=H1YA58_9SPHI|nr:RagB/SusD family nutrient uptake outer membrane protein [Mucilaginibacter paludis]EHQ25939.1 RagB/SusD domain-containing protein [Mucilaginibacter paludis DSM 18603]
MKKDQKDNYPHHIKYGAVYKITVLVISCFMLSSLNSCKKLLDINPSGSTILQSSVFTDSVTIQAAIAGMYVNGLALQSSPYRFSLSTIPGFTADELQYIGPLNDPYINNNILSSDDGTGAIYNQSYSAIYNANALIAGVTGNGAISVRFQNQAIAEARFIRAFAYFYLVNSFGDVPLVLNTDPGVNNTLPRTPVATIYSQIIADLKFAQATLPADYTTISGGARTRVNKLIATAMLARVDLYTGNWADAEAQATTIINNSLFTLPTDLTKIFTPAGSTPAEAIWQLYNDGNGYTYYASSIFSQTSKIPTYYISNSLINSFEPGDARKAAWTTSVAYQGTNYTYPSKYKNVTLSANAEYYTVLRLAEQFLIRAEARLMQNNPTGAQSDINMIRQRAGLAATTVTGTTDLMAAIVQERKIEFNCEWGHRWYDLKRWGTINAVLGAAKPTFWKPTAALYPLPTAEITLDPNISQNPGYN